MRRFLRVDDRTPYTDTVVHNITVCKVENIQYCYRRFDVGVFYAPVKNGLLNLRIQFRLRRNELIALIGTQYQAERESPPLEDQTANQKTCGTMLLTTTTINHTTTDSKPKLHTTNHCHVPLPYRTPPPIVRSKCACYGS
ncbi:hypothetical protein T10_3453 [Trichinella papuae]|uniref:Uncharacterized protein n=1 Tax=Trichinella papuae TaxID=268474 RepID=A0A0V1MG53_9BILA|nr:hypothetical protein T10_3453 [Trichinella papuae]